MGVSYLDEAIPDLVIDLRYGTANNFVGRRIDGYEHARPILLAAAAALTGVQAALRPFGLGLKVFDAYRPQRAVDHFVRWCKDLDDRWTKPDYYPDVAKENLFAEGYIAGRSSHSRGNTVDVHHRPPGCGGVGLRAGHGLPLRLLRAGLLAVEP